jgi:hypothetical protein
MKGNVKKWQNYYDFGKYNIKTRLLMDIMPAACGYKSRIRQLYY